MAVDAMTDLLSWWGFVVVGDRRSLFLTAPM
jgi:hypothetical protein